MNVRHTRRWLVRLLLFALLLCSAAACGSSGDDDMPLDPDVPPITEGDWYRPTVDATWQWQLREELNTSYEVEAYDIDLFETSGEDIAALRADGRKVICYFSAGSSEDWRPDFDQFPAEALGAPLDEWEGERWLDIRSSEVHDLMLARLDLARQKGCDGVEPDNVDGYANTTGFPLTEIHQRAYNRFMANEAHERGLAVGLKNDGGQAAELVDYYDFELNEQCHELDECQELEAFTAAGKPIWNAEYAADLPAAEAMAQDICPGALAADIRTLVLPLELDDAFRVSCDEP